MHFPDTTPLHEQLPTDEPNDPSWDDPAYVAHCEATYVEDLYEDYPGQRITGPEGWL